MGQPWPIAAGATRVDIAGRPPGSRGRLRRVVNVMQQFSGFPVFNIDTMLPGSGG